MLQKPQGPEISEKGAPLRAAEYVRMSMEDQKYSIANQQAAIRDYARDRGYTVVRTYSDQGKSGLQLRGRRALMQLLSDVQSGGADYDVILTYDVSRWGRFQDVDESGFYEYLCRRAHIRVEYCAEPFDSDGGPLAALLKNIKRIMAAEYSREQSARVHRAHCHVARQGYRGGGAPPYGYRRVLVSADGGRVRTLKTGMRKALTSERVMLEPGPPSRVNTVQRIFRLYAAGAIPAAIATILNSEGSRRASGRPWQASAVSRVLANEVYLGTSLYNRESNRLRQGRRKNDPAQWIRVPGAFKPIVSRELFEAAQRIRYERRHCEHSDDALLARLRRLLQVHGRLSVDLIRADRDGPHFSIYRRHFGGMRQAYALIGYDQDRDRHDVPLERTTFWFASAVAKRLMQTLVQNGAAVTRGRYRGGLITINGTLTLSVGAAKYVPTPALNRPCWRLSSRRRTKPRFTVAVRLNHKNDAVLDYFLLPKADVKPWRTHLGGNALAAMERFRFTTFEGLVAAVMALRSPPAARRRPSKFGRVIKGPVASADVNVGDSI